MSKTPRTDAVLLAASDREGITKICFLCAQLEMELTAANAEIKRMRTIAEDALKANAEHERTWGKR